MGNCRATQFLINVFNKNTLKIKVVRTYNMTEHQPLKILACKCRIGK